MLRILSDLSFTSPTKSVDCRERRWHTYIEVWRAIPWKRHSLQTCSASEPLLPDLSGIAYTSRANHLKRHIQQAAHTMRLHKATVADQACMQIESGCSLRSKTIVEGTSRAYPVRITRMINPTDRGTADGAVVQIGIILTIRWAGAPVLLNHRASRKVGEAKFHRLDRLPLHVHLRQRRAFGESPRRLAATPYQAGQQNPHGMMTQTNRRRRILGLATPSLPQLGVHHPRS